MHVREATVGPLFGTTDVSGWATSMSVQSMPSASAAICEKIVLVPWPISVLADEHADGTVGRALHRDNRGEVHLAGAGEAGAVHERCEARCLSSPLALRSRARTARASRDSRTTPARDRGGRACRPAPMACPTASVSPTLMKLRRRKLIGREPDSRARLCPCGARERRGSAAPRSRERRRAAACWWRPLGRARERSGTRTGPAAWMVPRDSTTGDSVQ